MLAIFFLICFNYNILRTAKDTLVVTAKSSGAETLPFLKVWAILPMALFMTFLFSKLSNRFAKEKVFYIMISIFLAFFFIFSFFFYPNRDVLHPHEFADKMQDILPIGLKGFIAIFRNWTYSAYYMMAEMWSTIMMTVLFWGFANDVTSVKDAKRLYALLGLSANASTIASGSMTTYISNFHFSLGGDAWGNSITVLNGIIIVSGLITIFLFRYLNSAGLGYKRDRNGKKEKAKVKMGLLQNFSYLSKSKYLICIAAIVVTYNISMNLIEVVWKDQLRELYPNPNDFSSYYGYVQTATGIVATITSIFISGNVIRQFSWTTSAMITPAIMLITGVGFFSFTLFKDLGLGAIAAMLGSTPLFFSVFFGSLHNCLSRASKFTLFDTTKELSFIPLSEECKLKGKAAIDGVGSRLGKSGSSVIHQMLLMIFGTVSMSTPYVGVLLLAAIAVWVVSVKSLGKQFTRLTEEHEQVHVPSENESNPVPTS